MIKMIRVYGDMYVPREYCTFTNPVTSGGTEEVDYVKGREEGRKEYAGYSDHRK